MTTLQSIGIWSRNHKVCTDCGKDSSPHRANGLCVLCYFKGYRKNHREQIKAANRKYQVSHREKYNAYKRAYNQRKKWTLTTQN